MRGNLVAIPYASNTKFFLPHPSVFVSVAFSTTTNGRCCPSVLIFSKRNTSSSAYTEYNFDTYPGVTRPLDAQVRTFLGGALIWFIRIRYVSQT